MLAKARFSGACRSIFRGTCLRAQLRFVSAWIRSCFTPVMLATAAIVLMDGLLKVNMLSPSGNERILCFLGPSAVVGELSMMGLARSTSVVAVRPTMLSFLSRDAFKAFAKKHPELYEYLVILLAGRLRETDAMIAAGSFLPREGRLACTLLELAGDFGQDVGDGRTVIRQKICQSDLAAMAGIARESANRIINDWQRRKMISRCSGYYCIENKDQLQREAELSAY